MVDHVNSRQGELAKDFLKRFDSTLERDATIYFNDTNSKDPFVPPRAGYELGVLVVRKLAEKNSLKTMAHWSQQEAKPKVREALVSYRKPANLKTGVHPNTRRARNRFAATWWKSIFSSARVKSEKQSHRSICGTPRAQNLDRGRSRSSERHQRDTSQRTSRVIALTSVGMA
jgi:hypothetical protein